MVCARGRRANTLSLPQLCDEKRAANRVYRPTMWVGFLACFNSHPYRG